MTTIRSITIGVAAAAAAVLLAGCNSNAAARAAATGTAATSAPAATVFTVPQQQMSHIQIVQAKSQPWTNLLRLTGTVDYNQFATTPVLSQVSGPVARVLVVPGENVRQGQPLLEVSSPDLAQARSAYLKAQDASALADKVYRRDADLYEHKALAEADLQQAESARTQAIADLETARQNLSILGVSNPAKMPVTAVAVVRSPIAGQVVERDVAPGQLIQSGTQCFIVSNLNTVWVLANVYQSDLGYVHVGDPVAITTDAYPRTFHGRIQFIASALDPTSRTVQARIATANPGGMLKKQMYVTATIQAGSTPNVVAVPNSAILRDSQNLPFVYVPAGNKTNQFTRRMVEIGDSINGFTRITSGLSAGESVVADGSLFLQFGNANSMY